MSDIAFFVEQAEHFRDKAAQFQHAAKVAQRKANDYQLTCESIEEAVKILLSRQATERAGAS